MDTSGSEQSDPVQSNGQLVKGSPNPYMPGSILIPRLLWERALFRAEMDLSDPDSRVAHSAVKILIELEKLNLARQKNELAERSSAQAASIALVRTMLERGTGPAGLASLLSPQEPPTPEPQEPANE